MSIQVENLSKFYDKQKALNNVSFSIHTGEIVGFLGPNGAGKSTMMKVLTGFIPQTSGLAKVCDLDVQEEDLKVKSKVGYLPENNPLYTDMYVKEYLTYVCGIYKAPKSRVQDLISKTGLEPEQHKRISQLSKGFRQRVGLAAALIHDPEVLILDEPTTGLDPNQLVEIRNLIKDIGKEKTVMLSTHIMQEVEQLCDRVIIINKGEIVADESIDKLKSLSASKGIVIEFNQAPSVSKLKKVKGVEKVISISDTRFEIKSRSTKESKAALFQFSVENNLEITEISEKTNNLESVFQSLTK